VDYGPGTGALFSLHEFSDLVMVANKEKNNLVSKLKENAVFNTCADFPVVPVPVFKAEAGGQGRLSIQMFYENIDRLINLLLPWG